MDNLYNKVVDYVDESFGGKKRHFERTVYWIERFFPTYTEAHRVAAYSHDIERAFRNLETFPFADKSFTDDGLLKYHQETGANIMGDFLKKENAEGDVIKKVQHLILKHEIGGDDEQDAMMDADSVSFLETNAEMFVTKKVLVDGYENVRSKLDWMFDRIKSPEAKREAEKNYKKWVSELEKQKK